MKKYKRSPTKLFQVRVSKKEYDKLLDIINGQDITRREFLIKSMKNYERQSKRVS
jgi:hypothetical protein